MLDESEYLRWMDTAKRILRSAYGDLERGDYNWACFKAQQSVEIAVKALLRGIGSPAYGHSITRLLIVARSEGIDVPESIIECAKALDKHYIPTRYPNVWPEGAPHEYYTRLDASNAIKCAEESILWIEKVWKRLEEGES